MDIKTEFCTTRSNLEDRCLTLVSRLFVSSTRLATLVGRDHKAFQAARAECQRTRKELSDSRKRVIEHRIAHGC